MDNTVQGPFRAKDTLVLASASPRRQRLLTSLGISFLVSPSKWKEPPPGKKDTPSQYATDNSKAKAKDVAKQHKKDVIIGADTVVVHEGHILGKPRDEDHAVKMLTRLCGSGHEVTTGCTIIHPEQINPICFSITTEVWMAPQAKETIQAYVDTKEPMGKAGAYAIQGIGAFLVQQIRGSYTNVVGLPLWEIAQFLLEINSIELVKRES